MSGISGHPSLFILPSLGSVPCPDFVAGQHSSRYMDQHHDLNWQRTMIAAFKRRLSAYQAPLNYAEMIDDLVTRLTGLEECRLWDLLAYGDEDLNRLRVILSSRDLPVDCENQLDLLFKALVTLSHRLFAISADSPAPASPLPEALATAAASCLMVCRICEENVKMDDFERHTPSCIAAYRSESHVEAIDAQLMMMQNQIIANMPAGAWPGDEEATSVGLLLLDAEMIVRRVIHLPVGGSDTSSGCETAEGLLNGIIAEVAEPALNELLCRVREAVGEKKRAARAFAKAMYVLKRTQVSGSGRLRDLSSISIAHFTFIKRISAGAYARVFLAQKQKTGDIYAIKVLPKTEVVQKNQMRRVMLERDILLQFSNPYIINFCMFYF
jgi:hypothetical protein